MNFGRSYEIKILLIHGCVCDFTKYFWLFLPEFLHFFSTKIILCFQDKELSELRQLIQHLKESSELKGKKKRNFSIESHNTSKKYSQKLVNDDESA